MISLATAFPDRPNGVMSILSFTINCPDHDTASDLAEALLSQRIVACANIGATVESRYRWNNQIERTTEVPLTVKTRPALKKEVEAVVMALHPYDVPPIIHETCQANAAYEEWVRTETGG